MNADITQQIVSPSGTVSATKTYTGGGWVNVSESVADSSTDYQIVVAIDVSQIKAILIKSDQNITIETNSSSAPDDTLSIVANVPYVWTDDSYFANLLTVDVTKIYVTNASGAAATVEVCCLYDTTP